MSFPHAGKVWMNGSLVDWNDAKIHIAAHVVHYGSGVFEGARCYKTPKGPACFRLEDHMRRLYDSARIYRMEYGMEQEALTSAVIETIRVNGFDACYIRPLIYRGYNKLGVDPFPCPVDAAILVWEWGTYLGQGVLEQGVDVRISTWRRMAPSTLPAMAKSVANYGNSILIKMEALAEGYSEGIALDPDGLVSEGSGQNIFVVRDGTVYTPPLASSVLPGITRDSVMTIARELGLRVVEQHIPREMLYIADEVFFAGTAVEVTPIRSIDKIPVADGKRGPITAAIQKAYFDIITGVAPDRHGWLRYVNVQEDAAPASARQVG